VKREIEMNDLLEFWSFGVLTGWKTVATAPFKHRAFTFHASRITHHSTTP
jgi:hypothetical protein